MSFEEKNLMPPAILSLKIYIFLKKRYILILNHLMPQKLSNLLGIKMQKPLKLITYLLYFLTL